MLRLIICEIRNNKRLAWVFLAIILSNYSLQLIPELDDYEPYPDYYANLMMMYLVCDPSQLPVVKTDDIARNFLKQWFNCFSYKILGNDRVMPMVFSIITPYLVYLLAHQITKDRLIGLIASFIFTINPITQIFDTSPTYDQAWSVFFLLSILLLYNKASFLSPIVYPLSILSKVMAVWFLPAYFYHIINEPTRHKKTVLILSSLVVAICGISVYYLGIGSQFGFHPERLIDGFQRLFESLWPIIPHLIAFVGLASMFRPKQKMKGERLVCVWMLWILLMTPMVYLFSLQEQYGYRFVPFFAFMSIFFAITLVNMGNFVVENRLRTTGKPKTPIKTALFSYYKFWLKKPDRA